MDLILYTALSIALVGVGFYWILYEIDLQERDERIVDDATCKPCGTNEHLRVFYDSTSVHEVRCMKCMRLIKMVKDA